LSWRHACIAPLPADLFSIPAGLQTLPTALINILFCFSFCRWLSGVTLKNLDIFSYFQTSSAFFHTVLDSTPAMFYL
jgi:hypothetical protein